MSTHINYKDSPTMPTKYVVGPTGSMPDRPDIRAYKCSFETAKDAWLLDYWSCSLGESVRVTKGVDVFDSWAAAHAEVMRRAFQKLSKAERQMHHAQEFMRVARSMEEPTCSIEEPT